VFRSRLLVTLIFLGTIAGVRANENEPPAAVATPALYVFAHEDDEIFMLGKMRRDVLDGREVHAVWITDGAKDGKAAARERESRAVMALLGIPPEQLHFLGFPDHESVEHLPAIFEQLELIANSRRFSEINSPAYEGGNIDHDVAAFMGSLIARRASSHPTHLEFPLYNHFEGHRRIGVFLPNGTSEELNVALEGELRTLVLDALRLYRSQRVLLTYLKFAGRMNAMLTHGEPYRVATDYNFLERPAGEPCGYERSGVHRADFRDWQREVARFLNETAPPVADARTVARQLKRQRQQAAASEAQARATIAR
jgi:LmbE family N-acetylglucosaminyl deacetylase